MTHSQLRKVLFGREYVVPCIWCLRPVRFPDATLEHLKPCSLGGKTSAENCDISCAKCNGQRGRALWVPARKRLRPLRRQWLTVPEERRTDPWAIRRRVRDLPVSQPLRTAALARTLAGMKV
jgi:hypothetical protein